jgi:hypothetical protein
MTEAVTFVTAWLGFALLSLTMKRHAPVLLDTRVWAVRVGGVRWLLRALGASLLIVALAVALAASPQLGMLHWIAHAALAAVTVVGILTISAPRG